MSWISDFKAFAIKGNVVDMAVGVVIGAAFGKIVSTFVSGIIMPVVGIIVGGTDFSALSITLKAATAESEAVLLKYGLFIQSLVDFFIVALAIFWAVRVISKLQLQKREEQEPAPTTEELLTQIRDSLAKK